MRTVHKQDCSWKHNFSRQAIVLVLCFIPMASATCYTRIMILILGAFLGEVQMNVSAQEIVNPLPSCTTARKLLHETAVDVLTLVMIILSGTKTYFTCDEANKRGACHMIKHNFFYDLSNDHLVTWELDSDACVGTN